MLHISNLNIKLSSMTLQDINLSIEDGEYFVILGPTGSGKTILLESIAGLYPVANGQIILNGNDITESPPEIRGIGMVYQDQSLFPHMSVKENIIFSLKIRKSKSPFIDEALDWVNGLINISHLWNRYPGTLSGGERQQVSLARALIKKPDLLLLDEPLSALDPETRENMREELSRIQQNLHLITIHVTHDFEEAISIGQRIAVLGNGRIHQVGTSEQIFRKPETEFVARFAMARNIFKGKVSHDAGGQAIFKTNDLSFDIYNISDGEYHAMIRPEDISISHEPINHMDYSCFSGKIAHISYRGATVIITVHLPPNLHCILTHHTMEELGLRKGDITYVFFKKTSMHLFA